ncbi:MAG TPA: sigma-70 family RNA polymerase sigma factor [Candidatus Limnocylindria bacterium]|nr:sigma-70 family RNA polymerase sigma factor [Candidatus Limnocylindria bacterium]
MTNDDMELVREYARGGSEDAFATLVSRHVNLVYSVALRSVRDPHSAEEVTQTVFVILARKSGSLDASTILSGWLCRTARYVAARTQTAQRRRECREQEAYMQSQPENHDSSTWVQIEPHLEQALAQLGEKDHNALVLRYFEGRNFKDVSAALGTTEAGAKMRVNRALEKLRQHFLQQGLNVSSLAIAGAVSANSIQAAPAGLAASITGAVKAATLSGAQVGFIKTIAKIIMAWTKLKTTVAVGLLTFLAVGTATTFVYRSKVKDQPPMLAFVGYATPEASMQSTLSMASTGNLDKTLAGLTAKEAARFKSNMEGKSAAEIRQGIIAWANAIEGYQITQKEVVSDDEVHLHISAPPSPDALRNGQSEIVMRRIGGNWKVDGDVNDGTQGRRTRRAREDGQ